MEMGLTKKERKQETMEVAIGQVDLGIEEQFPFQEKHHFAYQMPLSDSSSGSFRGMGVW